MTMKKKRAKPHSKLMEALPCPSRPVGLARCTRCGAMYELSQGPQQCKHHPGMFGNHNGNLMTRTWSCCGLADDRAEGCRVCTGHTICEATAAALAQFPLEKDSEGLRRRGGAVPGIDGEAQKTPESEVCVGQPLSNYTCVVGDTLSSVALKHGMRAADLRRWNKLISPGLFAGQQLLVAEPPAPAPEQGRALAVRQVMRSAGSTRQEAEFYVDDNGGDAERALQAFEADRRFEQEQANPT